MIAALSLQDRAGVSLAALLDLYCNFSKNRVTFQTNKMILSNYNSAKSVLSRTQGNKGGEFTFHRLGDLMCSDSSAWSLVLEQFLAQKCAAKCCQQQTVRQFVTILEQCFCHAFVNLLVQYLPKISSIDNTPRMPPVPSGIKNRFFCILVT